MKVRTKSLDIELEFWYPATTITTETKKREKIIKNDTQGHILFEGHLMCKQTHKKLFDQADADTFIMRKERIPANPICPKCAEAYKSADWSPWKKWTEDANVISDAT